MNASVTTADPVAPLAFDLDQSAQRLLQPHRVGNEVLFVRHPATLPDRAATSPNPSPVGSRPSSGGAGDRMRDLDLPEAARLVGPNRGGVRRGRVNSDAARATPRQRRYDGQ